ncbi:MAG: glycosyltransferase family 2 protein [Hespellia sp.]|nr:glycosyltransferase family 2 protein [Hespellia sp.]
MNTADKMFELTVVIPNHNKANYLKQCIDSVFAQTLGVKEVIVFDDCSTDDSLSVLHKCKENYTKLKVIPSMVNVGVSAARDIAIRQSVTPYVTFIDADDFYWDKNKLMKEMQIVQKHYVETGALCCAYSQTVLVNKEGNRIDSQKIRNWDRYRRIGTVTRLYKYWIPRDYCFPKDAYIEVGGFEKGLSLYEDWDLNLRLYQRCKFCFSGVYGTAYRQETGGLSSINCKKHYEKKKYVFSKNKHTIQYSFGEQLIFYILLNASHIKNEMMNLLHRGDKHET